MSDNRGMTIALSVIAILLCVASVLVFALSDTKGPRIEVDQRNITYVSGDDTGPLLDGVTAFDKVDGDVTNSLLVKEITVLNSGDAAKVTYAARDKHNNISEGYRIVTYVEADEDYSELDELIDENNLDEVPSDNIENDGNELPENIDTEEEVTEEDVSEDAEDNSEQTVDEAEKQQNATENTEEDKTPKITLKQKSVNIGVGQTFNPSDYVKLKENASSIEIDGAINVMVPGTYPLTFIVTGQDGKKASETLTVVVK